MCGSRPGIHPITAAAREPGLHKTKFVVILSL
jgi:hypothetical protein